MQTPKFLLATTATLVAAGALSAQGNFAEGFDSQATANVTVQTDPDTAVTFVDYSNMTIGATAFSIPEAPRRLPGSAPTRGVVMQANITLGAAAAVNVLAGATPIQFAGRYRLSYDCWQNVPVPLPGGSTEQLVYGVGCDGLAPLECRRNRALGAVGVFGWLAGENGYASEDAAIWEGPTVMDSFGDLQAGRAVYFNDAFDAPVVSTATNNAPANQWVRVDVDVDGNTVRVYYNGVLFHNVTTAVAPSGFALIGYEDAFNSLGTNPDAQWGLFDNFRVTVPTSCTFQGSSSVQGTASGGQIMSGAADPMIGAPMTVRLRGGPASGLALLNAGFPSPITVPIPFGGCTLQTEVLGNLANIITATDALGNSQLNIEVPASTLFCGVSFGFQYFFPDSTTACGVAHTEGLALMIGS